MIPVNSIQIPYEYVDVCNKWYSYQDDLLYAIASTGNLTLGNRRPIGCNDKQWYLVLWRELSCDISRARQACEQNLANYDMSKYSPKDEEYLELMNDFEILEEFENWVDNEVIPKLEMDYDLTDWEI